MTQPPFSGAPQPVQGVTGGPPVLGGQIGNDPNTGNVVINPNPGNAVEIKKSPSAFNVYEYFNSNTDNVRLTMETALGGPEVMGIVAAPTTVNRDLIIQASGSGHVQIPSLQLPAQVVQSADGGALNASIWTDLAASNVTIAVTGAYFMVIEMAATIGAGASAINVNFATGAGGTNGAGGIFSALVSPTFPAGASAYVTSAFGSTLLAGAYKMQGFASAAGVTGAVARIFIVKIG